MSKEPLKFGSNCPSCGAVVTIEEADQNRCGACGYPEEISDEELDDDFLDEDDGAYAEDDPDYGDPFATSAATQETWEDDQDDQDPNDSRNL